MNLREYIIQEYKSAKLNSHLDIIYTRTDEDVKLKFKQDNYINTSIAISTLLGNIQFGTVASKHLYFKNVLCNLLLNCIVEDIKPKTEFAELGYGYNTFEYRSDEQLIMQFLEGYLSCQIPAHDVVGWIELGVKLKIINFNK